MSDSASSDQEIVAGEATSTPIGTEVQAAATPMYSIYEIASDDITFGSPRQSWKQSRHFLDDPTVLAIGGLKGQADAAPALTFFNCRTREWSSTDLWNHIPISLSYFGLAHLPESRKLFVIGGDAMMETVDNTFNKASREVISIDTNNLRQKQCSSISKGLIGLTCCAASANQLLACGGFHYAPKFYRSTVTYTNKFLAFSYVYNVETGLWKEVKRMIDRRAYAAGANVNDRIYMTAGFEGACTLNEVEYYDFPTNRWICAPRLPSKRMQHGALSTHGVLFVCGGMDMNFYENTPIYTSSSVFLDPRERGWKKGKRMLKARSGFGLTEINDDPFVIGGFDDSGSMVDCELFDWRANKWIEMPSLPVISSGLRAVRVDATTAEGLADDVSTALSATLFSRSSSSDDSMEVNWDVSEY
ncbi:hypothetical protein M3Y94_00640700 [Aphelenchoides besseyi]|nr:hypothetical protein M3Y94_00640700 [Aphelenchoides besseyi]